MQVFYKGTVLSGMEWVQLDKFVSKLKALRPNRLFK